MRNIFDMDKKITTKFVTKIIPIQKNFEAIAKNKETFISIVGLAVGCHDIKTALLTSTKEKNIYAANILLRSLIEHYTKFIYVTYRFSKEENNDVGRENLLFQKAVEIKSYGNSLDFYKKLFDKNYTKINKSLAIAKISPEASEKSAAELEAIDRKFKYRAIIKFFNENEKEFFNTQENVFPPMVVQYSELSSFTHGGAWANQFGGDVSKEYINYLRENVIMIAASVYSVTFLTLSRLYPEFSQIFHDINREVNNIKPA